MSVRSGVGLVSGAAAAPGAAFARELATRCERILLLTRRPDEVQSLARELEAQAAVSVLQADLASRIDSGRMVDIIRQRGPLDYLVNVAESEVQDQQPELQERVIDAQIKGTLVLTRAALAGMRTRGQGLVVNVVFAPALMPQAGAATFGAAQSFLAHYALALRREVAAAGIGVRCLYVGCPDAASQGGGGNDLARLVARALAAEGPGWIAADASLELAAARAWWNDELQSV